MDEGTDKAVVNLETKQPSKAALPAGGRRLTMGADVEIIDGHLKVARGGSTSAEGSPQGDGATFEFYSDEPAFLGGENRYPQPLLYVAAGVGF